MFMNQIYFISGKDFINEKDGFIDNCLVSSTG